MVGWPQKVSVTTCVITSVSPKIGIFYIKHLKNTFLTEIAPATLLHRRRLYDKDNVAIYRGNMVLTILRRITRILPNIYEIPILSYPIPNPYKLKTYDAIHNSPLAH